MKQRVKEFESGEKYVAMRNEHRKQLASKEAQIKKLQLQLAEANSASVTIRNNYFQVIEDMEKSHRKELCVKDKRIKELFERSLRGEQRAGRYQDEIKDLKKLYYEAGVKLENQEEINRKLVVALNRNHENSSLPSSSKQTRKKIYNCREKSGKNPGGQPGHKGHGRKRHEPTRRIEIEPPKEFQYTSNYEPSGRIISKQLVSIRVVVDVDEYYTTEYRDLRTGRLVHAAFPAGMVNEVSYDGSIKAFAFMLNNYCNVSIEKVREFLAEITGGQLEISHGMISSLSKEFSEKTKAEREKIFAELLSAPSVCVDFTNVRNNGKQVNVFVCGAPTHVMYFARLRKGFEGVAGTPLIDYVGKLVHDHDLTFYNYGTGHQECTAHPLRYLKGSIENEKNRTWNVQMRELLQEMIHYRNMQGDNVKPNLAVVDEFKVKWREILEIAKCEYEDEPPSRYYREGFKLYRRLDVYMDYHFTFLEDYNVPATNNFAERLLRLSKRKQQSAVTFRSFEGLEYYCDALTIIATMRLQGKNLFSGIMDHFA
jgi:hypothetical protein